MYKYLICLIFIVNISYAQRQMPSDLGVKGAIFAKGIIGSTIAIETNNIIGRSDIANATIYIKNGSETILLGIDENRLDLQDLDVTTLGLINIGGTITATGQISGASGANVPGTITANKLSITNGIRGGHADITGTVSAGNASIGTTDATRTVTIGGSAQIEELLWFTSGGGGVLHAIGSSGTNLNLYSGAGAQTAVTFDKDQNANFFGTVKVGSNSIVSSLDPQVYLNTDIDDTGSGNAHGFGDESDISRGGTIGYASYDAQVRFTGSNNYDHYAGYQYAPIFNTSGTITNMYGAFLAAPNIGSGGSVTNDYGIYSTNAKNYFGGNMVVDGSLSVGVDDATRTITTDTVQAKVYWVTSGEGGNLQGSGNIGGGMWQVLNGNGAQSIFHVYPYGSANSAGTVSGTGNFISDGYDNNSQAIDHFNGKTILRKLIKDPVTGKVLTSAEEIMALTPGIIVQAKINPAWMKLDTARQLNKTSLSPREKESRQQKMNSIPNKTLLDRQQWEWMTIAEIEEQQFQRRGGKAVAFSSKVNFKLKTTEERLAALEEMVFLNMDDLRKLSLLIFGKEIRGITESVAEIKAKITSGEIIPLVNR